MMTRQEFFESYKSYVKSLFPYKVLIWFVLVAGLPAAVWLACQLKVRHLKFFQANLFILSYVVAVCLGLLVFFIVKRMKAKRYSFNCSVCGALIIYGSKSKIACQSGLCPNCGEVVYDNDCLSYQQKHILLDKYNINQRAMIYGWGYLVFMLASLFFMDFLGSINENYVVYWACVVLFLPMLIYFIIQNRISKRSVMYCSDCKKAYLYSVKFWKVFYSGECPACSRRLIDVKACEAKPESGRDLNEPLLNKDEFLVNSKKITAPVVVWLLVNIAFVGALLFTLIYWLDYIDDGNPEFDVVFTRMFFSCIMLLVVIEFYAIRLLNKILAKYKMQCPSCGKPFGVFVGLNIVSRTGICPHCEIVLLDVENISLSQKIRIKQYLLAQTTGLAKAVFLPFFMVFLSVVFAAAFCPENIYLSSFVIGAALICAVINGFRHYKKTGVYCLQCGSRHVYRQDQIIACGTCGARPEDLNF